MKETSKNHTSDSPESDTLKEEGARWKEVEFPPDLLSEGLVSLEVLEDSSNLNILELKPKKKRKKQNIQSKKVEDPKEPDVTLDSDVVLNATKGWSSLSGKRYQLPFPILRNLYKNGLISPTPIQKLTFKPSIFSNKNILISSETGSGKTLCFVLPIVISLNSNRKKAKIVSLVMLPTRELAVQMLEGLDIRVLTMIGGISIQKQERLLMKDPGIVVATPGRMADFIREGKMEDKFEVKHLVLDEADKFFQDDSFKDLELIVKYINRPTIQHFLSSATILYNKENLNLLFKLLSISKPFVCISSKDKQLAITYDEFINNKILYKKSFDDTNTTIPENLVFKLIECEEKYKELKLLAYLVEYLCNANNKKCIIFVNTVTYVYRLESLLSLILWKDPHESGLKRKYCATSAINTKLDYVTGIHSRLKQKQRLKRLENFTNRKKSILICTDVASRGLDIANVDIVIHFHAPKDKSLFLHRSGRTARLNAEGVSVCICCPKDEELWRRLFSEVNKDFNKTESIMEDIPRDKYIRYKSILEMADDIERNEHQMSKEKKFNSWFQNAAKKADIFLSDEEEEEEGKGKRSRLYKIMKADKKRLLKLRSEVGIDN